MGNLIQFDHRIFKQVRDRLNMSQHDFVSMLNYKSKGALKMAINRYVNIEKGRPNNMNGTELALFMSVTGTTPMQFFKTARQKKE